MGFWDKILARMNMIMKSVPGISVGFQVIYPQGHDLTNRIHLVTVFVSLINPSP